MYLYTYSLYFIHIRKWIWRKKKCRSNTKTNNTTNMNVRFCATVFMCAGIHISVIASVCPFFETKNHYSVGCRCVREKEDEKSSSQTHSHSIYALSFLYTYISICLLYIFIVEFQIHLVVSEPVRLFWMCQQPRKLT